MTADIKSQYVQQAPAVEQFSVTTPAWQRATGGESLGVPASHDWQREVAVDELARAAAPAEQTRSDSSWSATRRLCLHKAIPLTATLVGVAMSALESEHNPVRVPTVRQKETRLLTMQVFPVEDNSALREDAAKANTGSLRSDYNWSDKAVWHEKDKESATSDGFGARLAILCAAVLEEAHRSQGGAANSIRLGAANLGIKVSSSPAVQNGETEAHRGSGYSTRRPESTERSHGSDPRHEARDESAVRADDDANKA